MLIIASLLAAFLSVSAQNSSEPADSLVRLMSAQSAELIQNNGESLRKVIGPARFLHNGTYLICDTAYWYVESEVINAVGHVKILQDETVLTSDKLDYLIKDDLAQFRGSVVQLDDKEHNTLRTRHLDYNTKDSVAVFRKGASMRDKDGQIIESDDGSYDSKTKIFKFENNVNMFTDSVFVKTGKLTYFSSESLAEFDNGIDAWQGSSMLSSISGTYDRDAELFHFYENVHGLTDTQEGWADTLHFAKLTSDIELHGNVQINDDEKKVAGLAGHVFYVDSLERITMTVDATVIAEVKDSVKTQDTIYFAADRLIHTSIRKCDIDSSQVEASKKRLEEVSVDPVSEYRRKAAEEAQKKADEQEKELAKAQGRKLDNPMNPEEGGGKPLPEQQQGAEAAPEQSAAAEMPAEEAETAEDTGETPDGTSPDAGNEDGENPEDVETVKELGDTTKIAFMEAVGSVRIFKSDMQARCDSLLYTDLDSLARMYVEPIVWNEGNRQYSSDSLTIVVKDNRMKKANLMSNAFITIQEDSVSFDQIRGAEMTAYFDTATVLQRFDALGGANAMFFLEENGALATVNKVESKMLSAYFDNGELQRIYYFENPHNDAYPTVQLTGDDKQMKGFKWDPDKRPTGKEDITPYEVRYTERPEYENRPQAEFKQTEIYFPGYMKEVKAGIAARDSARAASRQMRDSLKLDAPPREIPDSVAVSGMQQPQDSLMADGLTSGEEALSAEAQEGTAKPEESAPAEGNEPAGESSERSETAAEEAPESGAGSESGSGPADVAAPRDTIAVTLSEKELKKAERDTLRARKQAAHEAKWAEKDAKDAAKAAAKAEKEQKKYRANILKQLETRDANELKEQAVIEKYVQKYLKKKEKLDRREAAKLEKKKLKKPGKPLLSKKADDVSDDL